MSEQALAVQMPAMSLALAADRHNQMVGFVREIMVEGTDYGTIPGTSKATLLKPGAEKLTTFFGLTPRFIDETVVEDFSDLDRPFFFYRRKCQLWRGDILLGEASGSCNSREKKYRWRTANRVCPGCGSEAIIKGKAEYGGGWLCWKKKGGCGAKFTDADPQITGQEVGQVENPDVADLANTILKMADKRALVAATLLAVNASEFFTQDLEDIVAGDFTVTEERPEAKKKAPTPKAETRPKVVDGSPRSMTELYDKAMALGIDKDAAIQRIVEGTELGSVKEAIDTGWKAVGLWEACFDDLG